MIKLLLDNQLFASSDAITAATRKILSTTCAILALTWFCHLSIYLWRLGGGLRSPKGGPPLYTWKKLQCLKMIFRPFGAKKIKNKKLRMTPADPHPLHPTVELSTFLTLSLWYTQKEMLPFFLFLFFNFKIKQRVFQSFQSTHNLRS